MSETEGTLTEEECDRLTGFFDEGAARFETQDAYWIDGADSGEDYCLKCARIELVKDIARYRRLPRKAKSRGDRPSLGGGYRCEHDSTPFCATCGVLLDGSLTNYACESNVEHFLGYGFDVNSDDDRREMSEVIRARRWKPWSHRTYLRDYERQRHEEYFRDLHALGRKILADLPATQPTT